MQNNQAPTDSDAANEARSAGVQSCEYLGFRYAVGEVVVKDCGQGCPSNQREKCTCGADNATSASFFCVYEATSFCGGGGSTPSNPAPDPAPVETYTCSDSCFAVANCGVVGRPGGTGTCPSGQICCNPPTVSQPNNNNNGSSSSPNSNSSSTGSTVTTTTSGDVAGETQTLPETAILSDEMDRVIIGVLILTLGIYLFRFRFVGST